MTLASVYEISSVSSSPLPLVAMTVVNLGGSLGDGLAAAAAAATTAAAAAAAAAADAASFFWLTFAPLISFSSCSVYLYVSVCVCV